MKETKRIFVMAPNGAVIEMKPYQESYAQPYQKQERCA